MTRFKLFVVLATLVFFAGVAATTAESAEKASAKIKKGSLVKVHYTLTVEGEVIDSSVDGTPMELKVGSGQVITGFEAALIGMKAGEKKSFEVSPEEGYGEVDPSAFQEVPREYMPSDTTLEVGMLLYAQDPNGQRIPARVSEIKDDVVVMDFNHPLAGKTLNFDVEIVSVE